MHVHHSLRRQAASLLLAGLTAPVCPAAPAQQTRIDCKIAFDMASSAYDGAKDALANDDQAGAQRMKDVFWRIEKYSNGCKSVRKMGEALAAYGMGPDATPGPDPVVDRRGVFGSSGSAGSTSAGRFDAGSSGSTGMSGSSGAANPSSAAQSSGSTGTSASGSSVSGSAGAASPSNGH